MHEDARLLVFRVPVGAINAPASVGPARLGSERLASIERVAQLLFEEAAAAGSLVRNQAIGAELQRLLLSLVGLRAAPAHHGARDDAPPQLVPRSVRRAQALMMAAPRGRLSVEELAARCDISVRTLQDNFRRFTGFSPLEWWRGYRLDRVHSMLSAGRPGIGVTEAATAYGFYHLGRFAEQYRARFGEPPSATLRRVPLDEG